MGKKERTKQFIIEKAANIFNQKGYAGTSMSDIVEATQLSKGAIYGCFSNEENQKVRGKQAIAIAAFDYSVDLVTKSVRRRSRQKTASFDKLFAAIEFYREYIFNEPVEGGCPILNMAPEVDDTNPILRERVVNAMHNWEYSIQRVIEKGIEKGEINPNVNAEEFAIFFVAALEGGILLAKTHKKSKHLHIVLNQLERMVKNELMVADVILNEEF